jgi:hypothetical protein
MEEEANSCERPHGSFLRQRRIVIDNLIYCM